MEKFEKRLKMRVGICWLMIAALLVVMVVVGELDGRRLLDSRDMDRTAQDVSRIIFFGALIGLTVCIARAKRLLRRSLDRRERQILEEDERRQEIRRRSGALAMNAVTVLLLAAVFMLAYVNTAAFYTAYGILLTALAVRGAAVIYYSRRM